MADQNRRVVYGAFRGDRAPQTTETLPPQSLLSSLGMTFFDLISNYSKELVIFLSPIALLNALHQGLPWELATPIAAFVTALFISVGPTRRFVVRQLRHSRRQRQWNKAARFAGLATMNDHIPVPIKISDTPVGERLRVRIPSGSSASVLENAAERLATCLEVREVRIEPDKYNARYATVDVVRRDPLEVGDPLPWPNLYSEELSLWQEIPVGVNEFGETCSLKLPERNLLLGGEPGAGKSVALSQLVATAALDPSVRMTLLDGKRVELAPWSKCAEANVGPSISDACDVLRDVQRDMDARYEQLLDNRKRKVEQHDGIPLHVIVCDELAFYLTMGQRKENQEFETIARDVVARGRAAGIIFLAATQRPSHDIVPTSLRDLFAFRWALRCTTPQASDTILGQGWASQGFSAQSIDAAAKGVGFLRHEGTEPLRIRSFCLSDQDIDQIARRAELLRTREQPKLSLLQTSDAK